MGLRNSGEVRRYQVLKALAPAASAALNLRAHCFAAATYNGITFGIVSLSN